LTPRVVLTRPGMSSLRLSLPYRVLTALRCRRSEPLPPLTNHQYRSTEGPQRTSENESQRPAPKRTRRMTLAPKHQRHNNGVETLASAPDTEASNTYDRIPLLPLATRTAARDTMKQHPGTSCLSSRPKPEIQSPGSKTPVYRPTPKCRPPKDPRPDSGHQLPTPKYRQPAASALAPAMNRPCRNTKSPSLASEDRLRRAAPKHLSPRTRIPIPATSDRHQKHRAPATSTEAPCVDNRRRDTTHRHSAPKHRAPTNSTKAPTDDRLPCGLLPFDVFPV
jgi:hypothetical protein